MHKILMTCLSVLIIGTGCAQAQQAQEVVVEPVFPENVTIEHNEVFVLSEEELDQMLAPIALYPDTVLAHVLIAATYPLEVVQAARWTERNPDLQGDKAIQSVESEDWDPSVKALVAFPNILQRMSEDLDWTQKIGDAFLDDEERLTARIQNLRQHAYDEGNLDSLEHLNVVREEEIIVIEPAVKEVVYVPYYDSRYVYGSWWWDRPPVYWHHPHHRYDNHYTSFYWGPRVHLSWGFFFSGFHWDNHHLVIIDHNHHRPNHYYSSRQVVRHRDSQRWQHNPRHRRGVDYRNPRTRDYFDKRAPTAASRTSNRSGNRVNTVRSNRQIDQQDRTVTNKRDRRNADYVRDRLQNSGAQPTSRSGRKKEVVRDSRGENSAATAKERGVEQKRESTRRGNIKLREQDSSSQNSRGSRQTTSNTSEQQTNPQRVERSSKSPVSRTPRAKESVKSEFRRNEPVSRSPSPKTSSAKQSSEKRSSSEKSSSSRSSSKSSSKQRSSKEDRSSRSSRSRKER